MLKGGIEDPDWSHESQLIWSALQGFTSVYHDREHRNQETGGLSKDCPSPEKLNQQIFLLPTFLCFLGHQLLQICLYSHLGDSPGGEE